jgi:hypothetical protein
MMVAQGMVGDMAFYDSDRDTAETQTWWDEDGDVMPWQGEDKDREARN